MFTLPASVRIYVAAEPVDLRRYLKARIIWSDTRSVVSAVFNPRRRSFLAYST
jgi:hypothetical protein